MPLEEKIADLITWFERWKRPFPWRKPLQTPYSIWVSEVMLQQTRAEVVIPYFVAWMEKFPTLQSLAQAPFEEVIKAWEGLGYYSRARRLWQGAKYLVENNKETLPEEYEELLTIPGFGPYTAGAVASFAFHKKAAAVDGNVIRVITRFFAITESVSKTAVQRQIQRKTLELLPLDKPWIAMEALIELGAIVCGKTPRCGSCPLEGACMARQKGIAVSLPDRGLKKKKIERLHRDVGLVVCNDKMLVGQVHSGKIMADLYEFPYVEKGKLHTWMTEGMKMIGQMACVEHSFTHFRAILYPYIIECEKEIPFLHYEWLSIEKLETLPFSSGHRQLLKRFLCAKKQSSFLDSLSS